MLEDFKSSTKIVEISDVVFIDTDGKVKNVFATGEILLPKFSIKRLTGLRILFSESQYTHKTEFLYRVRIQEHQSS
jgi:hypothetical protein